MKGIILAGGLGTRLRPLTKVTNKHLLPIYNKPMIYYPLETLVRAGLKEILIVSGPEHAGHFLHLLGSGKEWSVRLSYEIQDEPGGIAQALGLAEDYADNGPVAAILGDNIYEDDLAVSIRSFAAKPQGAYVFLKEVTDPKRFGVAEIDNDKIIKIIEKPASPPSNLAVTGCYLYDAEVFNIIKKLKPSGRGELEITDVNNSYVAAGTINFTKLTGYWTDAGTFESLLRANQLVAQKNSVPSED
ncbi:MAG: Glucose-1-phosphate thymidylyltransferase [Parcubacteria group bacterium GW2011_GWD2_43_10]|nr:MAG: Glucose-1-phosphate thymidylyltransferase [Parcubacteria group bacterium GW2011_GWD1_42_9]KKS84068.1 MAG: Glucose-1-phosphate thymidylyltransferase [Parcubacteria group bacterium GW2011_GWD2_43_10]KKT12601.1 MAG: Glucose-1-phosphate thymidylyltransferase [Parcubacteria group bacterium GW2011_GWA1_43_27]KKT15044.1 MAG: Glucose-1-phosphate thymidylyltransferase [Parcubacteria group bacterium GW2011_GWF2_43_38]KKT16950.1 MAG: Glucose-1-phosphate thymidylyltransferase [Parcubacteria group b